jgi:hypothetical protein
MPCQLCGEICRCASDLNASSTQAAPSAWPPKANEARPSAAMPIDLEEPLAEERVRGVQDSCEEGRSPEKSETKETGSSGCADSPAWREEVAARLNRYQSRRKPRPPRYPSLRLRFEDGGSAGVRDESSSESSAFSQTSRQALALDEFAGKPDPSWQRAACGEIAASESHAPHKDSFSAASESRSSAPLPGESSGVVPTAKIIEFPRSWTSPAPPLDELAEPIVSGPRILEVPDVVSPPPALGGITIEAARQTEMEKRPGIDFPLQSASPLRRILSAVLDNVIIAVACVLFATIFWKLTALRPPPLQIVEMAGGLAGLFWAAYQYMLIVYSGTTPGLRLARLQLSCFDGRPAGRTLRRWRVLASFLSAVSLGMGYFWVFLDEDSLCWHDRITHTYLAPKNRK